MARACVIDIRGIMQRITLRGWSHLISLPRNLELQKRKKDDIKIRTGQNTIIIIIISTEKLRNIMIGFSENI